MLQNTPSALSQKGPSIAEYKARLQAVQSRMAESGVDVLVVDCLEHMFYLLGYAPPAAFYQPAFIPAQGDPTVIVRAFDLSMFTEQSWAKDCVLVADHEDPVSVLSKTLMQMGLDRGVIAFEMDSHFLPVARFRALEAFLPKARLVDFSGHIKVLRLTKSDYEIACLCEASRISDIALMAAIEAAGEGVPERDCAAAYYSAALRAGADNGRNLLMASGKRSDSLHGQLGNHTLERGDIMHVEAVPVFRGYGARCMRSSAIGAPSDRQREVASRLIELQDEQFEAMRPGAKASEVDGIVRQGVLDARLRESYPNITGYTLGFIGLPATSDFTRVFRADSDWLLESRMVFHMYTWAEGMAFSETVLVTDEGAERLTKCARQLFVR